MDGMTLRNVFVCHASENKELVVRPLVEMLKSSGISYWYDEAEIKWGNSLIDKVNEGLSKSSYVMVVLSEDFLNKNWPQKELNSAMNIEASSGQTKVLPLIVGDKAAREKILGKYPLLNDKKYLVWPENRDDVVPSLLRLLELEPKDSGAQSVDEEVEGLDKEQGLNKEYEDSTVFFSGRFSSAFPGVRSPTWFEATTAVKRLAVLFKSPLFSENFWTKYSPIWWWRGTGNMYINRFKVISQDTVLIDIKELKIKRICAVNSGNYYQSYIYVEAAPMEPTGLYPSSKEHTEESINYFGYSSEEYGLYKEKYLATRAEYDDNAMVIDGEPTDMGTDCELRVRYTSPYNFLIAAHESPINNSDADEHIKELLDGLLKGTSTFEKLDEYIKNLPKLRSQK